MAAYPTGVDVATFLNRRDDGIFVQQCNAALEIQIEFVAGFTRRRGFEDDQSMPSDLRAVIIASTARLAANPLMLRTEHSESYTSVSVFDGSFPPQEVAVLNRYRRRAA
jgi:hypothetical protein